MLNDFTEFKRNSKLGEVHQCQRKESQNIQCEGTVLRMSVDVCGSRREVRCL